MSRRTINVKVERESHAAISEFARRKGVSLSGLIEAFIAVTTSIDAGSELPVDMTPPTPGERLAGLVDHARRIDAERRAR